MKLQTLSGGRRRCRERVRRGRRKGLFGVLNDFCLRLCCVVLLVNVGNFGAILEYYPFTRIYFYFAE